MSTVEAELHLTVIARNNRLLSRRKKMGLNQADFAKYAGIPLRAYQLLEGMRTAPHTKSGAWKPVALDLAKFHCCEPEELWPESLKLIQKPRMVKEVSPEQLMLLPDVNYENRALKQELISTMKQKLTAKQNNVVVRHLVREETLTDIAQQMGLSRSRVDQILQAALRRLRAPRNSHRLREFVVDVDPVEAKKSDDFYNNRNPVRLSDADSDET